MQLVARACIKLKVPGGGIGLRLLHGFAAVALLEQRQLAGVFSDFV